MFYGKDGDLTGPTVNTLKRRCSASTCSSQRSCTSTPCSSRPCSKCRSTTTASDQREARLTPLFWTHINPYGRFQLDMTTSLDLNQQTRESIL